MSRHGLQEFIVFWAQPYYNMDRPHMIRPVFNSLTGGNKNIPAKIGIILINSSRSAKIAERLKYPLYKLFGSPESIP
jgi:hypothetical protein